MLFAVLCYNEEKAVSQWSREEDDATMDRLMQVQQRLARNRQIGPVARLKNTTEARTLRKTSGAPMVLDGPFAETKEQFLGFYVIDCASMDEAEAITRELAEANPGSGSYEIRPVSVFLPWNSIEGADSSLGLLPEVA